MSSKATPGRGATGNPAHRFSRIEFEPDPEYEESQAVELARGEGDSEKRPPTVFYRDTSKSLITTNDSPDVPFRFSLNVYRGCEHGCSYCYARTSHEYLDLSPGLDFETKIFVKEEAPRLLEKELSSRRWQPELLAMSGVTDPYQPIERRLELTRGCLEVLARFRNPVSIVTKNALVTRDLDHLGALAEHEAATVLLSITSLDVDLARRLEPRASSPKNRLAAIRSISSAGVPVGVLVAPVVPGLTDHELPQILEAAAEAGASYAGYITLRLPGAVAGIFENWLEAHRPERKSKVLNRLRALRGGRLNDPRFRHRMRGEGPFADSIRTLFQTTVQRVGLGRRGPQLSTKAFRRPGDQLDLFGA